MCVAYKSSTLHVRFVAEELGWTGPGGVDECVRQLREWKIPLVDAEVAADDMELEDAGPNLKVETKEAMRIVLAMWASKVGGRRRVLSGSRGSPCSCISTNSSKWSISRASNDPFRLFRFPFLACGAFGCGGSLLTFPISLFTVHVSLLSFTSFAPRFDAPCSDKHARLRLPSRDFG